TRVCRPATIRTMTHSNLRKGSPSLRLNPLSGEGWDAERRPFCAKFIRLGIFTMYRAQGFKLSFLALAVCGLLTICAAEEGPLKKDDPTGITSTEIIQRFAAKEKEFAAAREQYGYRQSVKVQTLDGDTVDGEYQQTFDVSFDDGGRKIK